MAQTEILLLKHIDKLGAEGDVVKVKPGFARNYLLPRNLALPLSHANKKRLDHSKLPVPHEKQKNFKVQRRLLKS
jgi:large subunit ribosomal protein L9